MTPFELVYGQEAMLPVEINFQSCRVARQGTLSAKDYTTRMMDQVDNVSKSQLWALEEIEKEKVRVCRVYNKKVRPRSFQVREMLWKTILPVGTRDKRFGKWSHSWEGPYRVVRIMPGNAYFVESLDRRELPKALNGRYLKKYVPSVWQGS
jgi:hypothetical protein